MVCDRHVIPVIGEIPLFLLFPVDLAYLSVSIVGILVNVSPAVTYQRIRLDSQSHGRFVTAIVVFTVVFPVIIFLTGNEC